MPCWHLPSAGEVGVVGSILRRFMFPDKAVTSAEVLRILMPFTLKGRSTGLPLFTCCTLRIWGFPFKGAFLI